MESQRLWEARFQREPWAKQPEVLRDPRERGFRAHWGRGQIAGARGRRWGWWDKLSSEA